ncbi:hypothetical protein SUGI_1147870 [Cryptomeria japonica]|uniref:E3 ubiquitin-protein ligase UPL1 isoform X2 n=1 Tax=Cryptomeria japonica TaxID=3369 RepID=UPI002414ABFB|nr:E3 ubiquitin-protein ligase UPL1 isoform X2 [Cryptomeria japonica]GLJ53784.1 hypothetical protein SUGI_1147870 [Cryptomeria japonica]
MRPARKSDTDPPRRVTEFIQSIISIPLEEIEAPLSRFTWDYDDKGSFHHWTELFLHFNFFLSKYVSSRNDLQLSDNMLDEEILFPKGAVLQILRVLTIIFENCRDKGSFSGLEHFTHLLSSNDPEILLAALQALVALVKINPAKLHLSGRLPVNVVLNRHLLALSQGWGSKEEGLGLFSCVVENGCDSSASQLGSTLHFEFYKDNALDSAENTSGQNMAGLQVVHVPGLLLQPKDSIGFLKDLVHKYQIPGELRFTIWTRIRYASAFSSITSRRQYTCIRLLAFMVLVQSSDTHEELGAFFSNDPEFMNDLMKVLQSEDLIPDDIRALAMWALSYQFAAISASQERSRALNVPNIVTNAANRVFLLSLLQKAVMSLTTTEACSISLVEGALYFFLAHVTSSSASPSPTRETGLIPALLPLLEDTNSTHMHLVVCAVKILRKFMDYSSPAVTLFRDLRGLDNSVRRLKIEVNRVVEVSEGSDIATSSFNELKYGQILYSQRRLIKALLKVLGLTTYAPATAARAPNSEESSLPSSLSLIFRHSHKFGGDIFSSGVTLMNELIHKDPTCFSMLHAAGLPTAFLDAISEDLLLPSSKALCCIPNGLDALCLNNVGLQAVTERNALQFLVGVFTSRKYLLSLNEGVAPLANAMEELMRHVPSLRGPGVDVIIEILRKVATMEIVGLESKEMKDCPVPMETDSEDKYNAGVAVTGTAAQNMTNERFLQLCISHAMVFVHRALETSDICRIFVEKKGIEALMSFLTLPGIPLSPDGMTVAVHMVAVSKVFTHQHSNVLAQVYCEFLRGHLRATSDELDPVAGTNLLAAENGLNQKVFWCFFVLQFFVFLADATRENRWLAALMTEFGNGSKDVLIDIGRIHREILWQIALFEDSKVGVKKDDGPSVKALTTDSDSPASDIDEHMPSSIGQYVDLILNQHRQSSVWNAEHQLFDLIHLFHDFGHRARLQRRLNMDSSSRSRQISSRQISSHSDEGTSRSKTESSKPKSLHSFCYEILRSLSFHISHLFSEMGKVMHLPSRRRDESPTVGPASKSVASTFANIFLDDLNFAGHINISETEVPISAKCSYLGKVVDFIQAVIVDRQESCNPVLLNSFYAHGVIKSLLTTFEATGQLLWTVMQTPSMMETEVKEQEHKDESDKAWIFSTLVTYAGLMDHLVRPTSILASNSSQFLVQPVAGGDFSLPKDPESFAKVLQSQVLKAVRPLWNHPLFPQCSVEFISLICSIMKHVYTGVDAKMVKATGNVGNASFQGVAPPLDESAIAMIVEMGFSRSRAEEALRHVRSNRVELAMEWLINHPEEASQEDDELARALALSLGNTDSSSTEEMATDQKVMEEEEDLVQSPPIDEILSTCVKLLQAKDSLAFPLRDLLVILCTRNDGQDRERVILFLVDQLKLCNGSDGRHNSLLSLTSHVLALILHEDNVACQVASQNGLVSVLLDVLSNFCPAEVEMESMPELKYVTAILLVLGHMVQAKPKSDSNALMSDQLKKRDESLQNSENVVDNQQKSLENAFNVGEGYMTSEEQKRAIDIVCNFIQIHFPSTTIQALLQLCARLTRVHAIALRFLEKGGLAALLNLPTKCLFSGFDNVATTIIRHILEDPHTLQLAMESEIRHSIVAASTRNIGGRVSPRTFLSNLAPVISRDPAVFILAARAVCQIEMHGERPYVILSKDREKEKGKEKEKLLEKDKQGTGDKAIQVEKGLLGNVGNGSIKISDVGGKTKGHKKSSHNFASVIEQLLDVVIQFSPSAKDDIGGKSQCLGSATDMEVDENPLDGKGKAVVGKDNVELECKSSAALARAAFILKLLTEILLMYPSAINVVLRRDTESSHFKGPLQGGSTVMGHGGPLYHVLNRLLPYGGHHSKEKPPNSEWRQKLSSKASQFLMAVCVRSGEGRRRVFVEIVNFLNAYFDSHDGGYKPPDSQMNAFIDFINDVLAARSPSGSNISAEVSKTLIDVGAVQALCLTLKYLDLDHPDSVKIVNGIVKALESLTVEQIQSQEDSENKHGSRGASDSSRHQLPNDGENQEGPSSDTIAQPRQNETDFDQMESSHDALMSIQNAANLMIGSEEDFTHESVEEDGVVADYSMDNGGQDSSADEDEEEEMSGDGGEEDAEDDDEDEEEDDEELDEDDVHHLSHPDADQDDQDVHELGDDFDEDDILEDEEDDDDENNFIFRLEDGIDMFNHFEVLGREGDFPSDPFHVMPIEEVFGANRRQGRTTSIYNLLGRTDDRGAAFQHPLLVPSVPSRSVMHRSTENAGDRLIMDRNLESTSAPSDLDSIFRTLRSGRPGNRLSNWADDSQQLRGTNNSSIALGIEELFVSQLRRATPVEDGPTVQGNDANVSHEKGEASVSQAADDGTPTLQPQEDNLVREEQEQSQTEGNIGENINTDAAQPLQHSSEVQVNQSTISGQHDLDVQDERNERSMRDVEAVSQDSSGSGATLGESLRSLEVEIGSADGHDDAGERPPLGDSQTTRIQALGRVLGATGNLNQINTSGNMEGVQVENTNRDPVQPDTVREMNQTVIDGASTEQQQTNLAAGPSIDPAFLEALPEDLRTEVLASQQNQPAQTVNNDPPNTDEIDPEFLAALPPDIQAEVLAQQRAQRLLQSRQFEGQPVDMDSASILATLPPDLRAEVLLTSPEAVLANISESLVTEARRLRQRFGYYLPTDRLGAARRTLIDRSRRNGSGIGGRNGSMGSDRVGSSSTHKTIFGDKLIEADGKPLVDAQALKAMLRLLRLVQPVYKGPLQRLLFNICTHSVTRVTLVQLLLDMLLPDVEGSAGNSDSDGMSSYRLYGCLGHVNYSRPQLSDGVPPLVSRRVLETLTHLAQNHPLVAKHLLYLEENKSLKPKRDHDMGRGKALMIDEENRLETINEEDSGKFPIVLLLKLLNQPLYSRSTAHLEQVMGLLKVIMQSIEIDAQSGSESQPLDSVQKPAPPDGTTDDQLGSSGLEMASHASSSGTGKKFDATTVLLGIPKTELRLLSSLLAREGLSELAYSHSVDVLMKLVKIVPSHRHLFINELANATETLSNIAVSELQSFGEGENIVLSTTLSGAAILRVLQALSSLAASFQKEKDDEVLPEQEHAESLGTIRSLNAGLEPLWQELSLCISKIENRSSSMSLVPSASGTNGILPPLPPGTQRVLPYIEAFFVTCEKLQSGQTTSGQLECISATATEVKEATSLFESTQSLSSTAQQRKIDEKGITLMKFAEKHKRLLNAFVRQNSGLLEKSLSLLLKVPRLIEFDNKRAYFRSKIRQHQDHQNYSSVRISVRRAYVLEDSYNQLRMRQARELKGRLNVHFQGEEGIDAGGLTREWYQLLSRVIFDKNALLFTTVGNEATFQPNPNSCYQTEHLSYFKFVGRVVAKALFDGQLLDVHFTRSFYKHILGAKVTYHDIEAVDPDYYKNLKWMLENDIRDMPDLTFSMDADEEKLILYEKEEVTDHELIPGGRNIRVTEENKHEYVDLVAEHRLTTAIRPQINAFLEGFNELVPRNLISIFNDKELELLISGLPEIDLDDLRANTEYAGYSAASPVIQWFWEAVQSFNKEDRARLIQFVTGTSKVPLEGFKALQGISGLQRFQIHKAYGSPDRLPSAHTCFNQLDLPEYPSREQLEERLLLAIHEANEGFGFG